MEMDPRLAQQHPLLLIPMYLLGELAASHPQKVVILLLQPLPQFSI